MNTTLSLSNVHLVRIDANTPRKVGRAIGNIGNSNISRVLTWDPSKKKEELFLLEEFHQDQLRVFNYTSKNQRFLQRFLETYRIYEQGIDSFPEIGDTSVATYEDSITGTTHLFLTHRENGLVEARRYRITPEENTFIDEPPTIIAPNNYLGSEFFLPKNIYNLNKKKISKLEIELKEEVKKTLDKLS